MAEGTRYDWLLLDADGTLFDFDRAQRAALQEAVTANGLEFSEAVHGTFARVCDRVWSRFERGEISAERLRVERFEDLLRELDIGGDPSSLSVEYIRALRGPAAAHHPLAGVPMTTFAVISAFHLLRYLEQGRSRDAALSDHAGLLPGAEAAVERLARRVRLLLVTNGLAEVQRARIGVSPIRRFLEDVVISDEIGVAKPQEGFMDVAFERMGGPHRERVLMVGDSLSADIEAGVRYGIDTCWFNPARLPLDGGPTPTYTIARLEELDGIVSGRLDVPEGT